MTDEQSVPKWGDPIESIPETRRDELRRLHDEQVRWAAEPNRYPGQSPFARATSHGRLLTGVEVFYLSAYAIAGRGDGLAEAVDRLRERRFTRFPALHLEGANLTQAHLESAFLLGVHLEGADLFQANLKGAWLMGACLQDANLLETHLEGARLTEAHLEGAELQDAHLEGANLHGAFLSTATNLTGATVIGDKLGAIHVADVHWQDVNLAVVQWQEHMLIGDEWEARELARKPLPNRGIWPFSDEPLPKNATREQRDQAREIRRGELLAAWRTATRANRQLAVRMRDQGMNDEADRFAYQGNVCQRKLYCVQGRHLRRFGSWLLDLVSGYGYRPLRSVATYLLIVALFGLAYWALGVVSGHTLTWNEAGVVSLTAFHGRGFFATAFTPGDPQAALAAIEAVIGLLIEITFIATFTQRFFAR